MNYFRRRKILKSVNFLDLHPVRSIDHRIRDDTNVTILLPRFRNRVPAALFQPPSKDRFININLDRFGSQAWLLIDGQTDVSGICALMKQRFPEELENTGETEERVTTFLSLLYQQRYITFTEIIPAPAQGKG